MSRNFKCAVFERGNPPAGKAQLVVGYKTSDGARLQMRLVVDHGAAVLIGNEALAVGRGSSPTLKAVVDAVKKADTGEYGAGAVQLMRELMSQICDVSITKEA